MTFLVQISHTAAALDCTEMPSFLFRPHDSLSIVLIQVTVKNFKGITRRF